MGSHNDKTALVTGAAGFIGSHLIRELNETERYSPIGLDDLSGGFQQNIPDNTKLIKASINDKKTLNDIFSTYDIDVVFHLAAYAAEGLSHFIRRFNYENNLIGSVNLINQSINHDVRCFVFASSIAVYGENQVPMKEHMTPKPEDPYGIAKYAVEMDLEQARDMFGLDYIVFRPHNVYGEYQNIGDKFRNVVGIFMNQIMKGEPLTIFGDGTQKRAFTYVGDITPTIARSPDCEKAYNSVFNIGADNPYSVNQLAQKVISAMGKESHPIKYLESRNEVDIAYSDHSAVRQVFGEQPNTSLEEGLRMMAEWVKKVGARRTPGFENIEVDKNLPPIWEEHIRQSSK